MATPDATNGTPNGENVKVKREVPMDEDEVPVTGGDLDPDSKAKKEDDKDKDAKIKEEAKFDEKKVKAEFKGESLKGESVKGEGVKGEAVKGESVKGEPSIKREVGGAKDESVKGEGAKSEGTKGEQVKGEGAKTEGAKGEAKNEGGFIKPELAKTEIKKELSKKDKKVKKERADSPGDKKKKKKDKKDKKRARSGSPGGKDRKRKSKWGPDVPSGFSMTAIPGGRSGLVPMPEENLPRFNEDEMKLRTIILENLSSHVTGQELIEFFNGAVLAVTANAVQQAANKTSAPVFACTLAEEERGGHRKRIAELKFRTPDGASVGMKLNGIEYKGSKLGVKRPDGFPMEEGDPSAKINLHDMSMAQLIGGSGRGMGPGGDGVSPKLSIFNLPEVMSEQIVRDLLSQFGKLRMMSLIRDLATGKIKGYGIFEYDDPSDVELAVLALNGFVCGQNVIRVQQLGSQGQSAANTPKSQPVAATAMSNSMTQKIVSNPVLAMQVKQGREVGSRPSTVVQLMNAVYQEDLMDDQDYDDIMSEIHNMASKHGTVARVIIPKPNKDGSHVDGVGKIFVNFVDTTAARKFQLDTNGRKFEHRVVCAAFYPAEKFTDGKYKLWLA